MSLSKLRYVPNKGTKCGDHRGLLVKTLKLINGRGTIHKIGEIELPSILWKARKTSIFVKKN